jgi:hypothetical protein
MALYLLNENYSASFIHRPVDAGYFVAKAEMELKSKAKSPSYPDAAETNRSHFSVYSNTILCQAILCPRRLSGSPHPLQAFLLLRAARTILRCCARMIEGRLDDYRSSWTEAGRSRPEHVKKVKRYEYVEGI